MDLKDDNCNTVSFQNNIIIKATRISWDNTKAEALLPKYPEPQSISTPSTFNLFDFDPSPPKKTEYSPQKKTEYLPQKKTEYLPQKKPESFDLLFPQ